MGYLRCKSCGGCYELQEGESPADFESCNCGGELEFYDSHGRKVRFKPIYSKDRPNSTSESPVIRLLMALVVFYIVYMVIGRLFGGLISVLGYVGPSAGSFLLILFIGGGIAVALILIVFMFKKS